MKLILLFLNWVLLLASCSNCRMDVKEIPLTFETLRVDSLLIGKSYGMLLKGSDLLIADIKSDSLFHWLIRSIYRRGRFVRFLRKRD